MRLFLGTSSCCSLIFAGIGGLKFGKFFLGPFLIKGFLGFLDKTIGILGIGDIVVFSLGYSSIISGFGEYFSLTMNGLGVT